MFRSELNHEHQRDYLFRQGYTAEEAEEILDRAARLQAEAAERMDAETLVQSAEEAGIRREHVEEAMREVAVRREQERLQQSHQAAMARQKLGRTLQIIGGGLFALPFLTIPLIMVVSILSGPAAGPPRAFVAAPLAFLGAFIGFFLIAVGNALSPPGRWRMSSRRPFGPRFRRSGRWERGLLAGERVCLRCGCVNPAEARFCNDCGEEIR